MMLHAHFMVVLCNEAMINTAITVLQIGIGLCMVVFGVHQMIKPEDWLSYLPQFIIQHSPAKPETDMRIHALGNIFFGLLIASTFAAWWAALLTLIWWLTILPFAFRKDWAIGMRDLTIIFAITSLLLLVSER